jgi:hypothetical protein
MGVGPSGLSGIGTLGLPARLNSNALPPTWALPIVIAISIGVWGFAG